MDYHKQFDDVDEALLDALRKQSMFNSKLIACDWTEPLVRK